MMMRFYITGMPQGIILTLILLIIMIPDIDKKVTESKLFDNSKVK